MGKKEPIVDQLFMNSIVEVVDVYRQLDADGKAWARRILDHFKGVMMDEVKAEKGKQIHSQYGSQDRNKIIVFPGCSHEAPETMSN